MRRLLRWTTLLCLTLIVCCAAAVFYGRSQPASSNPLRQIGFDVCDGKPCFRGVVPGVTTWAEAEKMFVQTRIGTETSDGQIIIPIGHNHEDNISVEREPKNILVNSVGMVLFSSAWRQYAFFLGSVIALYGPPCQVDPVDSYNFILAYPFLVVGTVFDPIDNRLTQRSLVNEMVISSTVQANLETCGDTGMQAWRGFASAQSYQAPTP